MDSSITGVSQALSDLEFRPLTWENTVSEAGVEPIAHPFALTTGFSVSVRDTHRKQRIGPLSGPRTLGF